MNQIYKNLWLQATKVAEGINKFIWAHNYFYIRNSINKDLEIYNVYINRYEKFSVKLDDGSEFFLIQPCPHLIYELYEAKIMLEKGCTDENIVIKAKAYQKFKAFFEFAINYCTIPLIP